MNDKFVFLDIETTGLEPTVGEMMEIAMVLTDNELGIIDRFQSLVHGSRLKSLIRGNHLDSFIQDMHGDEKSGLLEDICSAPDFGFRAPFLVQVEAIDKLNEWGITNTTPVCGSSVHFDRRWLDYHMPDLNDAFHYRNIDSSSDMEYMKVAYPDLYSAIYDDPTALNSNKHRALSDCEDSIDLRRRIDTWVYQPANMEVYGPGAGE